MEEHLLTANLVVDKSRASNVPLWILSLDLSKAFDRIDWGALWQALRAQGVSAQIIWILQCMYFGQHGVVMSSVDCSKEFHIRAGVRQGCVMSPHLFCAVLEWAMRDWKAHGHGLGIVLQENQNPLVDLRFADDILMFAASVEQSLDMLRSLVDALRNAGLILNVSKTKLLTTQAQPPDHVWLDVQTKIDVIRTQPARSGPTNGFCVTSTCQSSYASNISRPLSHRLPVLEQGIGRFTNINFTNSMWNGDDCYVLCWVPRRDWPGTCRGIRFCTAGTDASLISVKDFTCKVGLRHVFVSTGNSLRTLQVCHPEPGSDVLWNGFQLALVWADHQTLGARNWRLLLGSWDGKIGRLMPNIPEIGNMHVMLLLILQSSHVQCLKSSACTTNSKLEFRSAPAPLKGRLPACRLTD